MNRDRQMKKDIENKQLQARDEYAKNKPLYMENKLQEKAEIPIHNQKNQQEEDKNNKEEETGIDKNR